MRDRQSNVQSLTDRARQNYERPAEHPFQVGQTYANRRGAYEVMQIAAPKMTVRYDHGELVTADIAIFARIWENMQMPPERPEPVARTRAAAKPAPRPAAKPAAPRAARTPAVFTGLLERDFAPTATRATWRTHVGPLIAARLGEITGIPHKAFPVGNRPQLFIGREHHFSGRSPEHRAKFMFRLTADAAEYGFHVERDYQKMDLTWDWRRFIAALGESESWGEQVRVAMTAQELTAEAKAYGGRDPNADQEHQHIARWTASAEGLERQTDGESALTAASWQDIADALTEEDTTRKCAFHLLGQTSKAEAVASLDELVERVAQACAALLPLYSASAR